MRSARSKWLIVGAIAAVFLLGGQKAYAYVNGKPISIKLVSIGDGQQLRADAAAAYLKMKAAALAAGIRLVAESGFRTMAEQERLYALYKAGVGNLAAKPGYSNHQNGIAVDIAVGGVFTSATYKWLAANGWRFKFVNTGASFSQPEPWHWEFDA